MRSLCQQVSSFGTGPPTGTRHPTSAVTGVLPLRRRGPPRRTPARAVVGLTTLPSGGRTQPALCDPLGSELLVSPPSSRPPAHAERASNSGDPFRGPPTATLAPGLPAPPDDWRFWLPAVKN